MADSILKGTLSYADSRRQQISELESSFKPGMLLNFQKMMQKAVRQGYEDRMKAAQPIVNQQVDPTKVSGGTFADIIGFVEGSVGGDLSKMYGATMDTATKAQEMAESRLEVLSREILEEEEAKAQRKAEKAKAKSDKKKEKKADSKDARDYKLTVDKFKYQQTRDEKDDKKKSWVDDL